MQASGHGAAFCAYDPAPVAHAATGPLAGTTFCVKDLYDVAGYPTGCGHPLKLAQSGIATAHAAAIQALLQAGARFVGKTHLDELAYSLNGQNLHYGTPANPAAPDRIPGGSSSGSTAAVAAGQADVGLGSDTGGSVRIPASYCGLYGFRPSHGAVSLAGAMPFAPSYDTVGWCSRSAALLEAVGRVLLASSAPAPLPVRLLLAEDGFDQAMPAAAAVLRAAVAHLEQAVGPAQPVRVAGPRETLADWAEAFRVLQAVEIWQQHGPWVTRHRPQFGPGVRERFEMAAGITPDQSRSAQPMREGVVARMRALLPPGTVLVLPTAPDLAPALDMPPADLDVLRYRALRLLCIAGHAGLPQVTLPAVGGKDLRRDGAPLGLSLLAGAGQDAMLLALAAKLAP